MSEMAKLKAHFGAISIQQAFERKPSSRIAECGRLCSLNGTKNLVRQNGSAIIQQCDRLLMLCPAFRRPFHDELLS